jgi:hypothetical protein
VADLRDLDWAFTLPETVTADDLRQGYEVLVQRCRDESSHLPMSTLQQLRIERTLYQYIRIRQAERLEYGAPGGFASPGQEKDVNALWVQLSRDFDDILAKHKPTDREGVFAEVKAVILSTLRDAVTDAAERQRLVGRFADALEAAGA